MRPTSLMLFAAGFGTRMGALTKTRPKPLIQVAGKALLDHALAQRAGVALEKTVVNSHYLGAQIEAHIAQHPDILHSPETPDVLDTGGGLHHALPLLGDGPVFTMNTDAIWTGARALAQLAEAWDDARMDALLLLVPRARAIGHTGKGDFVIDASGQISRGPGHVYTGAQIIRTDLLQTIPDKVFSLNRLWDQMLGQGRMYGLVHQGGWCDVGHPGGIEQAETMLREATDG